MKKYILGIMVILLVVVFLSSYLLLANNSTDEKMIAHFSKHSSTFEGVVKMAKEDTSLMIVRDGVVVPSDAISSQRYEEYLKNFHDMDIKSGLERDANGDIFIVSSSSGLPSGGLAKGYAFKPSKLDYVFDSLDEIPSNLPPYSKGFRKITTDWYLFVTWED